MHFRGPRREGKEKEAENLFEEIIVENFPNLKKETETQIQASWSASNKINLRRSTPRHIAI